MNWILIALLTAAFYGVYYFFIKVSSGHINQIVGAVILQVVAALVGGLILIYLKITQTPLSVSPKGIQFAILAGIFVGLAEITSFYLFSKGTPASIGVPIIVGGSILVGSFLGIYLLKESLNVMQYFAIAMIIAGIAILFVKQ